MANVVPAWPTPDPGKHVIEEPILAVETARITNACNWLHAYGHAQPVVMQCWDDTDNLFRRSNAAYAVMAEYRIPPLSARASVVCSVFGQWMGAAGTGNVRFASVNGAANQVINIPVAGAPAWYSTAALTTAYGPGYEDLTVELQGNGADEVRIYSICVEYSALASPLAAGTVGTFRAFDQNELAADEPLSSDVGRQISADYTDLLGRYQSYYSWSGVSNSAAATASATMLARYHRIQAIAHQGTTARELNLKVWVNALNNTGGASDQIIWIYHGGTGPDNAAPDRTSITVPAAAGARAWYSANILLREQRDVPGLPDGINMTQLGFFPYETGAIRHPHRQTHRTTAKIYQVAAWGQ